MFYIRGLTVFVWKSLIWIRLEPNISKANELTHWGRVTCICVIELSIIGSDNGLSPGRRQAIIWTNAGILLIGPLGTNFSENLIETLTFSFTKMRLKVSSAKWRPFCLGLNVLSSATDPFGLDFYVVTKTYVDKFVMPSLWSQDKIKEVDYFFS